MSIVYLNSFEENAYKKEIIRNHSKQTIVQKAVEYHCFTNCQLTCSWQRRIFIAPFISFTKAFGQATFRIVETDNTP